MSGGPKSETDNTQGIFVSMQHEDKLIPVFIMDTPGFGDSEGRDSKHAA